VKDLVVPDFEGGYGWKNGCHGHGMKNGNTNGGKMDERMRGIV
jgi:hypothetical protein